jgi:hypothetical protein
MALLGTTDPELATLLGLDPEKIRQQQQQAGLLSAGLAMLAASGPSATPRSLGQIVGQGGMAGIQAYGQAGQQAVERGVQGLKIAEIKKKFNDEKEFRTLSSKLYKADGTIDNAVLQQLGQLDPKKTESILNLAQAGRPKLETIGEGGAGYVWDAKTQSYKKVAEGAPKPVLTGDARNVAELLGLPADPKTWTEQQKKAFDARYAGMKNMQAQDPTRMLMARDDILDKWSKQIEPDSQVAQRFKSLTANVANPTPVGDTAIIYSFAKILNPGEAIMEGDIRNILSNRSIPDKVKQAAQKAVDGKNLTEDERIEIQTIAYRIARDRQETLSKSFKNKSATLTQLGEKAPGAVLSNPYEDLQKPPIISVNFKGKKTRARLSPKDQKYYVQIGNEFYEVSE